MKFSDPGESRGGVLQLDLGSHKQLKSGQFFNLNNKVLT